MVFRRFRRTKCQLRDLYLYFQNRCTMFNRFIVTYHSNNLHINRSIKVFPIFQELVLNHINKDNDFISKQGKNYDMLNFSSSSGENNYQFNQFCHERIKIREHFLKLFKINIHKGKSIRKIFSPCKLDNQYLIYFHYDVCILLNNEHRILFGGIP